MLFGFLLLSSSSVFSISSGSGRTEFYFPTFAKPCSSIVNPKSQIVDSIDIALIDRILKGDQAAYPALIRRHKDYAFTVAFRILNSREDAEEVAQDAFMQAFAALNTFDRKAKFTTWFYRIVFNAALGLKRKNRIFTEDIEESSAQCVAANSIDELQKADQKHFIQKALTELSPDDVTMITLFYLKEFSLEEIAEIVNLTADTVKVKVHRARKRLAEQMRKQLKEEVLSLY